MKSLIAVVFFAAAAAPASAQMFNFNPVTGGSYNTQPAYPQPQQRMFQFNPVTGRGYNEPAPRTIECRDMGYGRIICREL